jgi:Ran GTPase-activating protein (RanGAP) involved in mRNA processing and transport/predicted  nucleic acid-binding Zn-ribbon protein
MCLLDIIRHTHVESLQIGRREESLQENRYSKESLMMICDVIAETNSIRCFGLSGVPLAKQKRTYSAKDFSKHVSKLLAEGTRLENLDISWAGLVDSDQRVLSEGFRKNAHLKYLNISNNMFPTGSRLVEGISHLHRLRLLDISACGLGEAACAVISKRFSQGWGIIRLNMSKNPIGTDGISKLLKVLCSNDTIVELNLSETRLESVIAEDLHAFLQSTTVLRDLDLSRNALGDDIAVVFGDILAHQDTIVNLWLATSHITDTGSLVIARSLVTNQTMRSLSLRDNFLSEQVGFLLTEILQQNETLWLVDLTSTQVDFFGLQAIDTIVKRNRQRARDRHLSDLRRKFVKLQIQKSKIPVLVGELGELNEQGEHLSTVISALDDKIAVCDSETSGTLDALRKAIDEVEKGIESERSDIKSLEEKIENLAEEKEAFAAETIEKTAKEEEAVAKAEAEASAIEAATKAYLEESRETQEKLEHDIALVEAMIKEIHEKMADPKELRKYEIPAYPFPEELTKIRPILADEPIPSAHDSPGTGAAPAPSMMADPKRKARVKKPMLKK